MKDLILTKIIATLGPASAGVESIKLLINEGVRVFRVNFSHGSFEGFSKLIDQVRSASSDTRVPVAILGDLSGPKIRTGKVAEPGIMLQKDGIVEFTKEEITGHLLNDGTAVFSTTYPQMIEEVQTGQLVLIDDGNVELRCTEKTSDRLLCKIIQGGLVTSKKGINLPETDLSVPALTEWDIQCLEFAVKKHVDYLALSFVRNAADVRLLKDHLKSLGARPIEPVLYHDTDLKMIPDHSIFIPIISKIEKPQAIDDLDNIVKESDAIMIARGDLGVEMDLAEVAVLQKRIIRTCHDHGVPVIVATQMLQSMIESPTPTRAEVSDVANAIFDGVDAVMLSGETAVGKWPAVTVKMMSRIARLTNNYIKEQKISHQIPKHMRESRFRSAALAHGVKSIVNDIDAALIVIWSKYGGGALYLSQLDIPLPILAFSDVPATLNRLSLLYGIHPELMDQPMSAGSFISAAASEIVKKGWAKTGDAVVFVYGEPIQVSGVTNSVYVHYLI
jgi:pyruvate kinase